MNETKKGILLILLILYVISPVDLCPGCPIDDIVLMLAYYVTNRRSSSIEG